MKRTLSVLCAAALAAGSASSAFAEENINFTSSIIDTQTKKVPSNNIQTAGLNNLFQQQKNLVNSILNKMGIPPGGNHFSGPKNMPKPTPPKIVNFDTNSNTNRNTNSKTNSNTNGNANGNTNGNANSNTNSNTNGNPGKNNSAGTTNPSTGGPVSDEVLHRVIVDDATASHQITNTSNFKADVIAALHKTPPNVSAAQSAVNSALGAAGAAQRAAADAVAALNDAISHNRVIPKALTDRVASAKRNAVKAVENETSARAHLLNFLMASKSTTQKKTAAKGGGATGTTTTRKTPPVSTGDLTKNASQLNAIASQQALYPDGPSSWSDMIAAANPTGTGSYVGTGGYTCAGGACGAGAVGAFTMTVNVDFTHRLIGTAGSNIAVNSGALTGETAGTAITAPFAFGSAGPAGGPFGPGNLADPNFTGSGATFSNQGGVPAKNAALVLSYANGGTGALAAGAAAATRH